MFFADTIAALATPPTESALAVVRLSGGLCRQIAQDVFRRQRPVISRRASVGVFHDTHGAPVDQCVFVLYDDNAAYTGEPMLEITCHGNPLIARKILDTCLAHGCRMAEPGEFTRRAFLNGRLDLSQAEAVADAIHARSDKALAIAQRQLSGELGRKVAAWTDRLLQALAELEAYMDFPEEDLPGEEQSGPASALRALADEFSATAAGARYAGVLRDGVRTVIIGAPNAGKSSLLNALLGEERALVSAEPGTTRDFIREQIVMGPHSLHIVDTAGLRAEAATELEQRGMARTHDQLAGADFCLLVVDVSAPAPELPADLLSRLEPARALVVLNKADLPVDARTVAFLPDLARVEVSARTGAGIEDFKRRLAGLLEAGGIVPDEEAVVVNARHAEALKRGAAHLCAALGGLESGVAAELVASDVRLAVGALGEVVGRLDNERMLDKLFATFCIGK